MEHQTFDASHFVAVPPVRQPPQLEGTLSSRRDCVRLRGLPSEADVFTIIKFLGEHASDVVIGGVHMICHADGRPSGQAFVQMDDEDSAFAASLHLHGRYIMGGTGPCYIKVLQCSAEDISNMGAVSLETLLVGGTDVTPSEPSGQSGEPGGLVVHPETAAPLLSASPAAFPAVANCPDGRELSLVDMCAHMALLSGLPYCTTVHDILALFPDIPELTTNYVELRLDSFGLPIGEALVTFPSGTAVEPIINVLHRHNISVELLIL
ncbi:RNA-binding protein sym-2-like [Haemaphysalis longicornis]